jgi:hypothetical protein
VLRAGITAVQQRVWHTHPSLTSSAHPADDGQEYVVTDLMSRTLLLTEKYRIASPSQLPFARGAREGREGHRRWFVLVRPRGQRRHVHDQLERDDHWPGTRACSYLSLDAHTTHVSWVDRAREPHLLPQDHLWGDLP